MKTVLLVDDEQSVVNAVKGGIETYLDDIEVLVAFDGHQALKKLNSNRVDLVITDINMPVMDGLELLASMSRDYPDIPFIVMTGHANVEVEKEVTRLGSLSYVKKPFSLKKLADNVSKSLKPGSSGYIHGVSLATFLQMAAYEQKTGTLEIRSQGRVGQLYLRHGKLIDAATDDLDGRDAALQIMRWTEPEIHIRDVCERTKNDSYMDSSVFSLVLEAARLQDEEDQDSSPTSHRERLEKAIKFAEGFHYTEASKVLVGLLKEEPNNPEGWLWYSRIVGTTRSVAKALKNARLNAPDNLDIAEEIDKFDLVKEQLGEDHFRRCPFCWSPAAKSSFKCRYCEARLSISDNLFTAPSSAKQDFLRQAIKRYTAVIERETNVAAHYNLAMAYLNLRQWEEALIQLHKAANLSPENAFLGDQLQLLLDYLASSEAETTKSQPEHTKKLVPAATEVTGSKPKRVLVVEDSPTTRRVVSVTLSQKGYEVVEARDGLEALSKVNEDKPDLVLLDILLPKMDGYKILSIIKDSALLKSIPVIMLTSKDRFLDKLKGKLAGSSEYLTKPFSPKKLIETVEKYLQ